MAALEQHTRSEDPRTSSASARRSAHSSAWRAPKADHGRQSSAQLHGVATTCRLVKPVDALRDHRPKRVDTL